MAAISDSHERALRLREVLEREGLGPSRWRERDCITLVRAVIRELSGSEPDFDLPEWATGLSEAETIRRASQHYGTLRRGWVQLLDAEPLLRRVAPGSQSEPGAIALTPARGISLDGVPTSIRGPLIGVIGPECAFWIRTSEGLRRARPVAELWEVR